MRRTALAWVSALGGAGAITALWAALPGTVDPEQARVCRSAIPAIEPAGARVTVLRVTPGRAPRSVAIAYRVAQDGAAERTRTVACSFAAEGLAAGTSDLTGIMTDRGAVSEAALYLLKHYYLETLDGLAGDPGPGDPLAGVPSVPRGAAYALQQVIFGLPRAGLYALLAVSYALLYGPARRINLAFGEIAAVGGVATGIAAAAAVAAGPTSPLAGLAVALAIGTVAAGLHGGVAADVAFNRVRPGLGQASLIATVGLSVALSEYLRVAGGTSPAWIAPLRAATIPIARAGDFMVVLSPVTIAAAALALGAGLALLTLMRGRGFGRRWRAVSQDPGAAALFGIAPGRVIVEAGLVSGALAGLSGGLVAVQFGALGFAGGFALGLKALAAAMLGGIASLPGSFLGGLAIGAFETLWSATLPIAGRDMAVYVLLVLAIVLGRSEERAPGSGG